MLYSTKDKFFCPICGSRSLACESYPYYEVRICSQCHDSILYKENDERTVRQCDLIKKEVKTNESNF